MDLPLIGANAPFFFLSWSTVDKITLSYYNVQEYTKELSLRDEAIMTAILSQQKVEKRVIKPGLKSFAKENNSIIVTVYTKPFGKVVYYTDMVSAKSLSDAFSCVHINGCLYRIHKDDSEMTQEKWNIINIKAHVLNKYSKLLPKRSANK